MLVYQRVTLDNIRSQANLQEIVDLCWIWKCRENNPPPCQIDPVRKLPRFKCYIIYLYMDLSIYMVHRLVVPPSPAEMVMVPICILIYDIWYIQYKSIQLCVYLYACTVGDQQLEFGINWFFFEPKNPEFFFLLRQLENPEKKHHR